MKLAAHQMVGEPCGQARKPWSLDTNVKLYDVRKNCYKSEPLNMEVEMSSKPKVYNAGQLRFRYYKQLSQPVEKKVKRRNIQQNNVFTEKVFPELCQLHTESVIRLKHEHLAKLDKGYDVVQFDQAAEQLQLELESQSSQAQQQSEKTQYEVQQIYDSTAQQQSDKLSESEIGKQDIAIDDPCIEINDLPSNISYEKDKTQEYQTYKSKIKINYNDYIKFSLPTQ